jgi:DNA-binding transcriptional regulator YiaG
LCLNVPAQAHIHLLYLLGKDEQEDLDAAERVKLRHWAEQIRNQP